MTDGITPVIFGEVLYDCFPGGHSVLGGAPFNVAWHLQAFSAAPLFLSRVGNDPLGFRVRDTMRGWGMDAAGLQLDSSYPTGRVDISLDADGHSFDIMDNQAYDHVDADHLPPLPEQVLVYHGSLALRHADSRRALDKLLQQAGQEPGGRVLVDVNLRDPWWQRDEVLAMLAGAWLAKLNEDELVSLYPEQSTDEARIKVLFESSGCELLLLTRGEAGASLLTSAGESHRVKPQPATEIADTVGAGDAMTAIVVLGILRNWPLPQMLDRAQQFASAIVGVRGAIVEDREFYQPFIEAWELA